MRGILGWGTYLPRGRLDRSAISSFLSSGSARGSRAVASYDEDSTTMGVEAGRQALRGGTARPDTVWFATTTPAYLDKTNATAVHAALRLDRGAAAYDVLGSVRSAMGALHAALGGAGVSLAVTSDIRGGRPGSADESAGGDAAAALLVGDDAQ